MIDAPYRRPSLEISRLHATPHLVPSSANAPLASALEETPATRAQIDANHLPPSFSKPPPPSAPAASVQTTPWSASAWLFTRQGSRQRDLSGAGLLGGSQAGVRIAYDLSQHGPRVQLYGRLSSALQRPAQGEAAIGAAVFPVANLPFYIAAERRVRLSNGGRNAVAVYAAGSLPPQRLAPGLHLDGYAQAGIVGLHRTDGFIDGRLSLLQSAAGDQFSLGASVSGGAQPGLSRLDIGPALVVPLKLDRAQIRASLEWRHRIAGNAEPRAGIALTLGTDF